MSQGDLFAENDNGIDSQRKCMSLPVKSLVYRWLIIFNWNGEIPFKVFERKMFKDIKDEWVRGQLKPRSRAKKLMVSALPAQTVSLFGKVDESK